jgi:hypothetical protein
LGKPSIFSREYEKRMKRRRRNAIIIFLAIILITSALSIKIAYNPIDYENIKQNIQAWIDSDTNNSSEQTKAEKQETSDEKKDEEVVQEELQKPVEEYINITLASGNVAKAIYVDDANTGKVFKTLDTSDNGVSYSISPSGKEIIVEDTNSVITLYNLDGTNKVISKDQYVSTSGSVFTKESTIQSNPKYLWNQNPKFISEDKIIFVTNRPYFGGGNLKKYLWMTDISTNEDKVMWDLAGANIEIGEKEEKGVKITVDGRVYFIDVNGNYIQ